MCAESSRDQTTGPLQIPRFEYQGFHGCRSCCGLEIIPLADGRTLVIATELADNPGTSVTNVAEHLASFVCERFGIETEKLVWVEHYGYGICLLGERAYDRVTFQRRAPEGVVWLPAVTGSKPNGWPGHFGEPHWVTMSDADWAALGLPPREPVRYEARRH